MKLTNIRCEITGEPIPRRELELLREYLETNFIENSYDVIPNIKGSSIDFFFKPNLVELTLLLKPLKLSYKIGA